MVFRVKIGRFELYNNDVHQNYIIWCNHTEKYIWKYFLIHYLYILTLTSPSPSVFEIVVHFELSVSTAMLFSLMRPFIWYTYCGWSRGSLTSPSAIQVKVVSKTWLRIRTQGPRLHPGRSRKFKNLTMNN